MLERETKQEKNLELRERDLRRARDKAKGETGETEEEKEAKAQAMEEQLRAVDADFLNMIKEAEDDEATAAAEGAGFDEGGGGGGVHTDRASWSSSRAAPPLRLALCLRFKCLCSHSPSATFFSQNRA